MSAKLSWVEEEQDGVSSHETTRATADFGNNAFRRRTLALVLDQQRIRAAFDEWERWKKANSTTGAMMVSTASST